MKPPFTRLQTKLDSCRVTTALLNIVRAILFGIVVFVLLVALLGCESAPRQTFIDHLSVGDDIHTQQPPK